MLPRKICSQEDDFYDYFHEEEVVFEYDENEEEQVNFVYPHQHQEMEQPPVKQCQISSLCSQKHFLALPNTICEQISLILSLTVLIPFQKSDLILTFLYF